MLNIEPIYFFILVLSILVILRNLLKFISALVREMGITWSTKELIIFYLSISYFLTYIVYI